jgi:hypothetical protein
VGYFIMKYFERFMVLSTNKANTEKLHFRAFRLG